MTPGIDLGEFGAQKNDLGRIKDPHEDDNQGTGGAIGGGNALAGQVETQKDVTDS